MCLGREPPERECKAAKGSTTLATHIVSCGSSLTHHTVYFYFYKAQVLVVAAAGNSAADFCPLYYNEDTTFDKILVGATDRNDAASWFSNYGPCVHMQVFNPRPPQRPPTQLLPHTESFPPHVCAGPRFQHPSSVGRLKQHRHKHHQWHQHGDTACFRRRRPAAREGPDPLGDATQGDTRRRGGGGCHRPFCQRSSSANAQPLPHRRRRTRAVPDPPVTSAVPTYAAHYAATLAALAAGASS